MGLIPSFTVRMDIHDILYLSYLVPEIALRPTVPKQIGFSVSSDGRTIVSLVLFRSRNVRASFLPFVHFAYNQANVRTYVLDPVTGTPAVFFLKSGITSPLVAAVTGVLKIPWQAISMDLDAQQSDSSPFYRWTVRGNWERDFHIQVRQSQGMQVNPFQSPEALVNFLTGPSVGLYSSPGILIRFEVEHSPIKPIMGTVSAIDFPLLADSGFLTAEELRSPQSVLLASRAVFKVAMPPTKVSL
jgi:uncharacterized protein YqjF (DUF2071 family)